ncbi:MAG TPA: MarR family transcriptional regulator [Gemmatimonadaceae bacterium]
MPGRAISTKAIKRGRQTRPTGSKSGPAQSDKDVAQSVDAFRRILRELRLHARRGEAATGLSPSQAFVLSMIAQKPRASVNEIAQATVTDRSSAAAVLDRLVERGQVVREQAASDRRRAEFTITARGRRAMLRAPIPPTVALLHGIRALSSSERRALATSLTALTHAMGLGDQPPGMLFDDTTTSALRNRTDPRRPGRRSTA